MKQKKIKAMHALFGARYGHTCGECEHCERYLANRAYYKCAVYGVTASEASDWRIKWTACGMFNRPRTDYTGRRVIDMCRGVRAEKSGPEPLAGQITIFEGQ